jgi:NADH dehydrogenase FAD-containing subunit
MSAPHRVVLIGAGHAHMEALAQAERFRRAGVALTLIDPGVFWYSGAATAMLAGALPPSGACADPARLHGPFEHCVGTVARIGVQARTVILNDGRSLTFDTLSLNTGSQVAASELGASGAIPVKPVSNLASLRTRIEAAQGALDLAVAGTGATGVETALALAALQRRLGAPVRVALAGPGPLLAGWPHAARAVAQTALDRAGVTRLGHRARRIEAGYLVTECGDVTRVDAVLDATGLQASLPDGLDAGAEGLRVGPDLAWLDDPAIFAAGDCACLSHAPRPKLGVFGVRAAPVLIDNLIASATGLTRRRSYHPQTRWLSLLDLGDGSALGRYGGLSHRSGAALWLKRWIDARFVRRYQPAS